MGKNKQTFEVQEGETIDECLERIQEAGFIPIKRVEKPIFKEVQKGSDISYEPTGRKIVFEVKKIE